MPIRENEPLAGSPARTDPGEADELPRSGSDPGDEYFSSGSFSPVTVQLDDEAGASGAEDPVDAPREEPAPAPDDSAQVIVQFGEDPGAVSRDDDPDDA